MTTGTGALILILCSPVTVVGLATVALIINRVMKWYVIGKMKKNYEKRWGRKA